MSTRWEFDHIGNYNFMVEIEGVTSGSFSEVSGLESETDIINFYDGNARLRKRPGPTKYTNIIFKRGFTNSEELWNWRKSVVDGTVNRKSGSIIILDESKQEIMRYNFFEAWPCRWKSAVLDASDNGLIVEELEISVEKIERG